MNQLKGKIISVVTIDQFSQVRLEVEEAIFISIVIAMAEVNASLKIGNVVRILFKETDVTLSLDFPIRISIANKVLVTVVQKQAGQLMTRIKLDFYGHILSAVVPTDFAQQLNPHQNIVMLIRSNEIMLMEEE